MSCLEVTEVKQLLEAKYGLQVKQVKRSPSRVSLYCWGSLFERYYQARSALIGLPGVRAYIFQRNRSDDPRCGDHYLLVTVEERLNASQ